MIDSRFPPVVECSRPILCGGSARVLDENTRSSSAARNILTGECKRNECRHPRLRASTGSYIHPCFLSLYIYPVHTHTHICVCRYIYINYMLGAFTRACGDTMELSLTRIRGETSCPLVQGIPCQVVRCRVCTDTLEPPSNRAKIPTPVLHYNYHLSENAPAIVSSPQPPSLCSPGL